MPQGIDSWVIQIKADIDTLKKQFKEAQSELDHITDGDHTVKLDIDTKSLDSAMKNLDKMLKSIGKGTGDFKQFENLSKQFNEMRGNIENVKKSLGTLNADKGMKSILTAINSIDSSLTTLTANLKGITSINTSGAEKEMKDLASAGDKVADSMERAAQAKKKLAETDLSSSGKKKASTGNSDKDTQKAVNQALKTQLSAWKGIQSVREQLAKTTDTSQIENLKKQGQLYLEEYNNAGKILQVNKELYNSHAHINEMMLITLKTNDKISQNQASQAQKQKASIDSIVSSYQKIVNGFSQKNNVFPSNEYKATVQAATDALKEMEAIQEKITKEQNGVATEKQTERIKKLKTKIDGYNKTVSKMTTSDKGSTDLKAIKEIEKIGDALRKNTRMSSEAKAQLNSYISELRNNPAANVEEIAAAWKKVVVAEKEAGRGGKSLFSAVGEKMFYGLAGQIANMVSLYDVINVGKQAINQVIELDTALVDLQKTTTMSSSQLNQFYYDANDVAKQMGVTTQEIIEQASAWSRFNKIDPLYSNVYRKPSQIMGNPIGRTIMRVMWKLLI